MSLDPELVWLAGLLEGEGSFGLNRNREHKRLVVQLSMTDKDVVDRAARAFPGATNVMEYERDSTRKNVFHVAWTGPRARDLMFMILDQMGSRRRQAMLTALANWYEYSMRQCAICGDEYSLISRGRRAITCGDQCAEARRIQREAGYKIGAVAA